MSNQPFALLILVTTVCTGGTFALRQQSAGVRGTLMCGDKPLANTKVKLWDFDRGPDRDDLLEEGRTDDHGRFQLSGKTSELTTIDVQLRIYHDCDDWLPCQRRVTFIIPDSYVSAGPTVKRFFDIGTINMEIQFQKEERDCLN